MSHTIAISPLASLLSIETTFGALLMGTFASLILYGLATNQTYRYYRCYPADKAGLKVIVGSLWVFDTLHTIFCIHVCHHYFVENYSNPLALLQSVWSLSATIGVGAIITIIANGFYARRIYIMGNKNIFITGITIILPLFQLGLAFDIDWMILAATGISAIHTSLLDYPSFSWIIIWGLASAAVTDVVLTITITYFLHQSRTGFDKTDTLIDKLMAYAVSTGFITSMTGVACLICVAVMPTKLIYMSIHFVLKKRESQSAEFTIPLLTVSEVYSNSLLVWLNSRKSSSTQHTVYQVGSFDFKSTKNSDPTSSTSIVV
ncbi:hypothetical protein BDQ12DRAFT_739924 [Crucibulum laeve]|uniref:DUF6534 domain-containing protein n=1 Tax=Crucibulum laeve TaxID=68775 RepID=A0A5C3LS29_9AGAR|nr:hypothetical protein BDQ12DRAFT_739924 [Crucibulum laeve]